MAAETYFGIDLGTTYSCIACVKDGGEATVLSNSESEQTTPSVVFFETANNVVVGSSAKQELRAGSEKAIARAKQFMGTNKSYEGYRPEALTPQEISAYVLRKLVQDAGAQIDGEVSNVVITCPAYFGLDAKTATKQAGELAGLTVHYVIPEPVAAAYYYATSREGVEDKTLLVYDLGGGTFDVTVIRADAREIREVCIEGDARLGGDDWDSAVANWLAEELARECGTDADGVAEHDETMQELLNAAETAKKQLSSKEATKVRVLSELGQMRIDFTREQFDAITRRLLDKTLTLTRDVVANARKSRHGVTIDEVLLVGGSTFMPRSSRTFARRSPTSGSATCPSSGPTRIWQSPREQRGTRTSAPSTATSRRRSPKRPGNRRRPYRLRMWHRACAKKPSVTWPGNGA